MEYHIDLKGLGQVMRNPDYTDKEKVLLHIVSDHCQYCLNTGRPCELSYSTIREWTGWNYTYISKTIKSLVERGDITADTEQLEGNRKSTTVFSSAYVTDKGYYQGGSNSATDLVVMGTTRVVVNNNTKKTTNNNNTIAKGTLSHKCESDFGESNLGRGEETTFLNGEGDKPDGKAEQPKSELEYALDQIEWCIDNDVWASDVSYNLAFEKLKRKYKGLDEDLHGYLKKRFDKRCAQRDKDRLSAICVNM